MPCFLGNPQKPKKVKDNKTSIIFQVTFVPKPEDDGSQLRCEAVNEAVSKPVYNTITIELMPSPTTTTSTTTTTTMTTTSSTNEMEIIDENTVQQAATDIGTLTHCLKILKKSHLNLSTLNETFSVIFKHLVCTRF